MKRLRTKWLLFSTALAICFLIAWERAHRHRVNPREWLLVSTPVLGNRTNGAPATPVVTFSVSNIGPRAVDFQVGWFECRSRSNRALLATNQLALINIPLPPGSATNLTFGVIKEASVPQDWLCCYELRWFEREPVLRRQTDRAMTWLYNIFGENWNSPWPPPHLTNGCVFAANVDVAEYFRLMHGFTPRQWLEKLEELERLKSAPSQSTGMPMPVSFRMPTEEEESASRAWSAFVGFCQKSAQSDAEQASAAK